jgi:hypothetical protein
MRSRIVALAVSVGVVAAWLASAGEAPATRPTTRGWRIVEVQGLVSYRPMETAVWTPALPGTVVSEEGQLRTGPRSKVVLEAGAERKVLDRLGPISIKDAITSGPTAMGAGMKYGRVRFDIESGGVVHESVIRSPSTRLAVRDGRRPGAAAPATRPTTRPSAVVRFVRFWFGTAGR